MAFKRLYLLLLQSNSGLGGSKIAGFAAMEETGKTLVLTLGKVVELVGGAIIAFGLIQFILRFVLSHIGVKPYRGNVELRVKFGSYLTLALELLLAADILQTAVAPTWDDIGKLAAIATIRTVLNYFLERDMDKWQNETDTRKKLH